VAKLVVARGDDRIEAAFDGCICDELGERRLIVDQQQARLHASPLFREGEIRANNPPQQANETLF
jgi:hypothetical protein